MENALASSDLPGVKKLNARLKTIKNKNVIESSEVIAIFQDIIRSLKRKVVIVVDEFGKNLEYMAHHYDKGDLFIIQQLAELDSVYLWVCLHQAFDEYVFGLSTVQSQEWSKIQRRFEDISFVESTLQMLYLIRNALKKNINQEQRDYIEKWAADAKDFLDQTNITNKEYLDINTIVSIYPLHPITAIALIELCRKYAQNERTLYLLSAAAIYMRYLLI